MMKYQRQEEQLVQGEGGTFTSHVHNNHPMSNYDVAELTWENGYPAMHGHGFGGTLPTAPITKGTPTWSRAEDNNNNNINNNTLESIVHQSTKSHKNSQNICNNIIKLNANNVSSSTFAASSTVKRDPSSAYLDINPSCSYARKRSMPSELSNHFVNKNFGKIQEECLDFSGFASARATFSHDNDMTIMTWPSFESPPTSKNLITTTADDDHPSFCHAMKEKVDEQESHKKEETMRSHSTRRSRAADVHNHSERIRRHKINQKMKALQKLVPNASKTDKASMLDEVIDYIKQLQAQVQLMNVARNMPHMMMTMQQQQLQMLARMGMGMNMSIGSSNVAPPQLIIHPPSSSSSSTNFMTSPFIVPPPLIQKQPASLPNPNPFNIPYYAFLAQSMNNIEIYNKMAELYKTTSESSQPSK